ncbi:MAG: family 20 glycosylhydrolase [Bacteroidales bacterium]|nr:family 20 glycosylhydrolase [Bacteroidales bacterium]
MKRVFSLIFALIFALSITAQVSVIPKPNKVEAGEGRFKFDNNTTLFSNEKSASNLEYLKALLVPATGFNFNVVKQTPADNYIVLDLSEQYGVDAGKENGLPKEGYILDISAKGITIKAADGAGIFYGIQSLLQLMPAVVYSGRPSGHEDWSVAAVRIEDSPRFGYRGMMLDVSRTFFDAATVKKYIDWMAYHKINKFHWHLTDDNGWRVEIKKYPLLTSKGAWRGPGEVLSAAFGSGKTRYGGFYTQEQIKDIVAYAAKRHIEVIPEIDLPGHSKAVTASYPNVACDGNDTGLSVQGVGQNVWCVGKEDNFHMLENIIKEMVKLFPSKNFHIGGDEVNYTSWDNCPHCQELMKKEGMKEHDELLNYFVRRMEAILEKQGRDMSGWDEILEGGKLNPNSRVYAWRSVAKGIESVTKGQPTIMMPGEYCYFDMKQSKEERGHNWAGIVTLEKSYSLDPIGTAKLSNEQANLIVGVQGALWTELLGWPVRFIDYQTYPRLAATAEVGWTKPELKEWDEFYSRMVSSHFERMFQMGIAFRVPPPVVKYEQGVVKAQLPYPWAVVRYTTDETNPTIHSPVYRGEIITDKAHNFRFATFYRDELVSLVVKPENAEYQYLKPVTTIITSMAENPKFPVKNLVDYKFETYFRSEHKIIAGDYLTYLFEEPVKAKRVTIETGIPNISFYGITEGYAEYSYDGTNYIRGGDFVRGTVVIYPQKAIKAIRVVASDTNDGHILSLQDLRIEE